MVPPHSGNFCTGERRGELRLQCRNDSWKKPDDDDVVDGNITMNYVAFIVEEFET